MRPAAGVGASGLDIKNELRWPYITRAAAHYLQAKRLRAEGGGFTA